MSQDVVEGGGGYQGAAGGLGVSAYGGRGGGDSPQYMDVSSSPGGGDDGRFMDYRSAGSPMIALTVSPFNHHPHHQQNALPSSSSSLIHNNTNNRPGSAAPAPGGENGRINVIRTGGQGVGVEGSNMIESNMRSSSFTHRMHHKLVRGMDRVREFIFSGSASPNQSTHSNRNS